MSSAVAVYTSHEDGLNFVKVGKRGQRQWAII